VIRTLIADDEAPARARLRQLLTSHPDIEIVGESETGIQTMDLAAQMKPDLLLLDIQMPAAAASTSLRACRRLALTWYFAPHSMNTRWMRSNWRPRTIF
jgi:DNA-binding NarL/FixJ family response regulator